MMFKTVLLLVTSCYSAGFVIRSCSDPSSYYNTIIHNPKTMKCPDRSTAQPTSAVFELCKAPYTGNWKKGLKVTTNCSRILKTTAVASFSGSGRNPYDGNKGHAAIFISCLPGGAIKVADQWCGHKFSERVLPKPCSSNKPYFDCADYFYTVKW